MEVKAKQLKTEQQLKTDQAWRDINKWTEEEQELPIPNNMNIPFSPKNIPEEAKNSRNQLFLLFFSDFFEDNTIPLSQKRAAE